MDLSIATAGHEEAAVHRVVEESFDSLRKDQVRALLLARKEAKKQTRL